MHLCRTQVFWKKLLRQEGARPDFTFKKGQYPEQVLAFCSLPSPGNGVLNATHRLDWLSRSCTNELRPCHAMQCKAALIGLACPSQP